VAKIRTFRGRAMGIDARLLDSQSRTTASYGPACPLSYLVAISSSLGDSFRMFESPNVHHFLLSCRCASPISAFSCCEYSFVLFVVLEAWENFPLVVVPQRQSSRMTGDPRGVLHSFPRDPPCIDIAFPGVARISQSHRKIQNIRCPES
jgi:hypothetical protein